MRLWQLWYSMYLFIYKLSLQLIYYETTATLGSNYGRQPRQSMGTGGHVPLQPLPLTFCKVGTQYQMSPYLSNWSNIQIFMHICLWRNYLFLNNLKHQNHAFRYFHHFVTQLYNIWVFTFQTAHCLAPLARICFQFFTIVHTWR